MADAAVHPALPDDIPHLARIQRDTYRLAYADLLPAEVLAGWDLAAAQQSWAHALTAGEVRLFVATEGAHTVGFCAAGHAPGEDVADADGTPPEDAAHVGLVSTLLVEPRWGRRGHGGRLLAAAAATLRADGAVRGVAWIPEPDEVTRAFYQSAGWRPDGVARTLDANGRELREIRLSGTLDLTLNTR